MAYHDGEDDVGVKVRSPLRLSQLADLISEAIEVCLPEMVWVVAEISQMRQPGNGHVYLDLVETENGKAVAQMRAMIWARESAMVSAFEQTAGRSLQKGLEVLALVEPRYHSLYGMGLTVHALDATYTLGSLARDKQRIRERLHAEGHADRNKRVAMPAAPVRIAVISSAQAAGYQDFIHTLRANACGIRFHCRLFTARLQGADAPESIERAFSAVAASAARFDVVVVLRGGGSDVDLACFDSWEAASAAACCPLPVITGIGHERDQSLTDEVAHTRCKTPTAAAEALVDLCAAFEERVADLGRRLVACAQAAVQQDHAALARHALCVADRSRAALAASTGAVRALALRYRLCTQAAVTNADRALDTAEHRVRAGARTALTGSDARARELSRRCAATAAGAVSVGELSLDTLAQRLVGTSRLCLGSQTAHLAGVAGRTPRAAQYCHQMQMHRLHLASERLRLLDPARVLARGYSLTYSGGSVVTRAADLAPGAHIVTRLHEGSVQSTVDKTEE